MKWLARSAESVAVWRRFTPQLVEHRPALLLVACGSLLMAGLEVLRPWPITWIIDGALIPLSDGATDFDRIVWINASILLGIIAARVGVEYLRNLELVAVGHAVTRSLRHRIFGHLVHLSPSFHQKHKSGDLLVRLMGDVPMLRTMLVDSTVELATRALVVIGMLGVMFWKDAVLTTFLVVLVPVFTFVIRFLSTRITVAVRKQRRKEGELADYLHEAIAGTEVIQSLGRSEETVREFARSNRRSARAGMKTARLAARLGASVESMLGFALVATLVGGSYRVLQENLSTGELVLFLSYVRSLLKPLRSMSKHAERVAKGAACGERILAVLDESIQIETAPDAVPAPKSVSELRFDGVSFSYDGGDAALDNVDLTLRTGELVGVFGASGAGKSTLASLALRLRDPSAGKVRLDGIDIREIELSSLRDRFGLCMQENVLFGESIRENLALGKPDATEAEMWEALRAAGADTFVSDLEDNLDSVLGAAGKGLSGGERRRLVLARTLLRKAPILIVDEPFSGLDRPVAKRVQQTLKAYAQEHLVLVIAHEQEHLASYDRVVFLEHGRITCEGKHEELLSGSAAYRAISAPVEAGR